VTQFEKFKPHRWEQMAYVKTYVSTVSQPALTKEGWFKNILKLQEFSN
jgi:hypothetical protein